MKAYIIHESELGTGYCGDGMYALVTEKEETIYKRWCTNRAFANHDLTKGIENMLREQIKVLNAFAKGYELFLNALKEA